VVRAGPDDRAARDRLTALRWSSRPGPGPAGVPGSGGPAAPGDPRPAALRPSPESGPAPLDPPDLVPPGLGPPVLGPPGQDPAGPETREPGGGAGPRADDDPPRLLDLWGDPGPDGPVRGGRARRPPDGTPFAPSPSRPDPAGERGGPGHAGEGTRREDPARTVPGPGRPPLDRDREGTGLLSGGVEGTAPLPVVVAAGSRVLSRWAERWLPDGWRRARFDPGRRGAVLLAVVVAAAAVLTAAGVWRDRPVAEAPPPLVSAAADPAPGEGPAALAVHPAAPAGPLVVSVVGRVRRPGLVSVPDGSRVADAIGKAGGALRGADLRALNLARRVSDGEQLLVGLPQPAPEPAGAAAPDTAAVTPATPAGPLDLNRASVTELDALPGVGPVTASKIVDWRTRHGRFSSVDQLREIPGIGERKFGQLRSLVRA
jgi:competence protein ComEA